MKRKIALLLITGICLANTVPCFASPSMKVSVSSSEENQYSTLPDGDTLQKDRLSVWQWKYYGII